jgi:predicted RNA-binding protein (virulence factor B family)
MPTAPSQEKEFPMRLGHKNTLKITQFTDHGALLEGDGKEILMPKRYVMPDMRPGDEVEVFVYIDQSGRLVATTETPLAEVGEFAYLQVAWTNRYGAFMNWGLMKDLFVPFSEQRHHFMKDKWYIVYIYIDDRTGRIVGTSKLDRNLKTGRPDFNEGDEVDLLVWKRTAMGYKVIINNAYEGLLYENQIFEPLHVGDKKRGVVSTIRDDGKIDVALQHSGRRLVEDFSAVLLRELQQADGNFLPYGDHTPPEAIASRFHVSKKAFKRAVGALYKQHLIAITDDGIALVKK